MYRLIRFIKRYYVLFLFIILEVMAIDRYARSTGYTKAKILNTSVKVSGGVYGVTASVGDWISLRHDNRILVDRLASAESELAYYKNVCREADSVTFSKVTEFNYFFSSAKVINNSINRQENYFLIDKGYDDGIEKNMAVLSADGVVAGYVLDVSRSFSVCMSILNKNFRIGGRIVDKEYFGSVYWDCKNTDFVILSDIPRYADIHIGDTVVSAISSRFPQNVMIGTVDQLDESDDGASYSIKVRLGTRMSRLSDVMVLNYSDSEELRSLEEIYFPYNNGM